jgi:glycosidase
VPEILHGITRSAPPTTRQPQLTHPAENIDVHTPYNYAYHGYWVNDVTKLNARFGSEDDLVKLITELHKRNMYIMIDIAVNSIPTLNQNDPSAATAWSLTTRCGPTLPTSTSSAGSTTRTDVLRVLLVW